MKLSAYENHIYNIPTYVAVFTLKKCWITEDKHYGRMQPLVGDEVYVLPHEGEWKSIIHDKSSNRYSRPAVSCLKFVGYKRVVEYTLVGDVLPIIDSK